MARFEFNLRRIRGVLWTVVFAGAAIIFCGCLSLGGRTTTYVQESSETQHRLDELEGRVGALERRVYPPPQFQGGYAPGPNNFGPEPIPQAGPVFPQ